MKLVNFQTDEGRDAQALNVIEHRTCYARGTVAAQVAVVVDTESDVICPIPTDYWRSAHASVSVIIIDKCIEQTGFEGSDTPT